MGIRTNVAPRMTLITHGFLFVGHSTPKRPKSAAQKKLIWLKFSMRVEGHMTEENTKFYSLERYSLRDTNFLVGVGRSSSPVALTLHRQ